MKLYKNENEILLALLNKELNLNEMPVNNVEASVEKHTPQINQIENEVVVTVGSVIHPMDEKHFIEFVLLETKKGFQFKKLNPNEEPVAKFILVDDEPIRAYAFCNLHGMWKKEI